MKILYPFGVETKVSISKAKGYPGNWTTLEDLARRLQTRKEAKLGREKQRSPLAEESRVIAVAAAYGNRIERERGKFRQLHRTES